MSKNPEKIHSLNVEDIIRGGLKRFTDQLGQLWCSLADYYTRSGLFDRVCMLFLYTFFVDLYMLYFMYLMIYFIKDIILSVIRNILIAGIKY